MKYTDGLGNSETYTYDKNGNRVSLTDRNGNTYTYTYDALNRVSLVKRIQRATPRPLPTTKMAVLSRD